VPSTCGSEFSTVSDLVNTISSVSQKESFLSVATEANVARVTLKTFLYKMFGCKARDTTNLLSRSSESSERPSEEESICGGVVKGVLFFN
jgi:hypothetical protein